MTVFSHRDATIESKTFAGKTEFSHSLWENLYGHSASTRLAGFSNLCNNLLQNCILHILEAEKPLDILRESCPRCRKGVGFNGGSLAGSKFCSNLLQNYILHIGDFDSHESSMYSLSADCRTEMIYLDIYLDTAVVP